MKMNFICVRIGNHFHINVFALGLTLKQRLKAIREYRINFFTPDKLLF